MKRLMFKTISTLLVFFLVLIVGKKILVVQANKMGGDFNKAVEYIKKGEYIDAIMAFTGDLSAIDDESVPDEVIDDTKELINKNKDKNIFDALKGVFIDMDDSIDKLIE